MHNTSQANEARRAVPTSSPDGKDGLTFVGILLSASIMLAPHGVQADASAYGGDAGPSRSEQELLYLEGGVALSTYRSGPYTRRLETFGWDSDAAPGWLALLSPLAVVSTGAFGRLGIMLDEHFGFHLEYRRLESRTFERVVSGPSSTESQSFRWRFDALTVNFRARYHLMELLAVYAQLGGGLGIGSSELSLEQRKHGENGLVLAGSAGLQANLLRWVGIFVEYGYTYARILTNNLGDKHQSGGLAMTLGARVRWLGSW